MSISNRSLCINFYVNTTCCQGNQGVCIPGNGNGTPALQRLIFYARDMELSTNDSFLSHLDFKGVLLEKISDIRHSNYRICILELPRRKKNI